MFDSITDIFKWLTLITCTSCAVVFVFVSSVKKSIKMGIGHSRLQKWKECVPWAYSRLCLLDALWDQINDLPSLIVSFILSMYE